MSAANIATAATSDPPLKKGDLVFWVTRTGYKFWGVIRAFNRSKRDPQAYIASWSCAHWCDLPQLQRATEDQVVRYERRKWGHPANKTRWEIAQARTGRR